MKQQLIKTIENSRKIKYINPFEEFDTDNYLWLELNKIPDKVPNPLALPEGKDYPDPIEEAAKIFTNVDYLHYTVRVLFGIEMPPFQCAIIDTLWRKRMPLMIGGRGIGKSSALGIYCLLKMVLYPGYKIVIVGNGLRQARQVFDYMADIWDKAPVLRDIAGKGKTIGPRREVDRFQFEIGSSVAIAIPLGQGDKIRGLRANTVIVDETGVVPEQIFNVVVQGFAVVAKEPMKKVKEAATIRELKKLGQWTTEMEELRSQDTGGNQIILAGTGAYYFNHFYKNFKKYRDIILSKGSVEVIKDVFGGDIEAAKGFNWKDFAILAIPYTHAPEGWLDQAIIAHARATLSNNQFLMEYCARFVVDSDGFYQRSVLEEATTNKPILTPDGLVQFSAKQYGDKDKVYVIAADPAYDRDNAAIVVLELHENHRRIIHCWTTNKRKFQDMRKSGKASGDYIPEGYYSYIAQKIRSLMRVFNTERIVMDKHGGGTAVAQELSKYENCQDGEIPVYEIPDPKDPKFTDGEKGVHILQLLIPSADLNSEANHGLLKDFQTKELLFPVFDAVELEKAIIQDKIDGVENSNEGYASIISEIEDLKYELTTIIRTESSNLGKDVFDTPSVKMEGDKKGRLRKDRFSALLYANYYARNRNRKDAFVVEYRAIGGKTNDPTRIRSSFDGSSLYYGPGALTMKQNPDPYLGFYRAVRRS